MQLWQLRIHTNVEGKIVIPENYWLGYETIHLGIPWLTPPAVLRLASIIEGKNYRTVEFGTGGSTIFFAKRCREVISFDSNANYVKEVRKKLTELGLDNVQHRLVTDRESYFKSIGELSGTFDCALIDTKFSDCLTRSEIGRAIVDRVTNIVVLDNYSYPGHTVEEITTGDWVVENYDDSHWKGNGTRICIRAFRS